MKHQKQRPLMKWAAAVLSCGGLLCLIANAQAVLFRLPLDADTAVHYYYDHGGTTDWKCGGETYSGHNGTDFSGGPRGKSIYAAANATLRSRVDGFGDGYVGSPDGGGAGNHVVLDHGGNFHTWYMHMTVGSVTKKAIGSSIACSEKIGGVGTSGSSSGLHLHFGTYPNGPSFVHDDPYSGACGGPITYWVNQNNGHPTTTCQGGATKTARIVDNSSAGFSVVGTWSTGSTATDKYGSNYRFHSTAPVSEPATWTTTLNTSATWNVRAWWPAGANRSASASYIVSHGGTTTTVTVNQQINGGQWVLLGSWPMSGTVNVKLSCWTSPGFVVVADAIKWD